MNPAVSGFMRFVLFLAWLCAPAYLFYIVFSIQNIIKDIKCKQSKTWSIVLSLYSVLVPLIIDPDSPLNLLVYSLSALGAIFALACGRKLIVAVLLGSYAYCCCFFLMFLFGGAIAGVL